MKNYKNELFTDKIHLNELITKNGVKNIYDAVSQCTRCGYCLESCPTYIISKKENHSPRGRNQIIRTLIEGKQKNVNDSKDIIDTCLLCSSCTDICYGTVPTPDIILEARREEKGFDDSLLYKIIIEIRKRKKLFDLIIKTLYIVHRIGLIKLADKFKLFHFLGYPSLSYASKKLIKPPKKFLHQQIENLINKNDTKPAWIYFLTCGTDYLFTNTGKASINVLTKIYGNGIFMKNKCCGLVSYNYGSLKDAKEQALKNIEIYENTKKENPNTFIVADCSSCVAFMKSYPQIFIGEDENFNRARDFSSRVRDIIEVIKPEHLFSLNLDYIKNKKITIHHSCKAYNDQGLKNEQEMTLKLILKDNLIELNESNMCCGGAGAYSFTKPEFSNKILYRKMKNISETQADITLVSSTSCQMQIGYGSKTHYTTEVIHYVEFIDKILL